MQAKQLVPAILSDALSENKTMTDKQKQAAVPLVLGEPPTTLKQPTVPGWVLRRVYDGAALIEGRDGIVEVEPGMITPGLGRVEAIKREDGLRKRVAKKSGEEID